MERSRAKPKTFLRAQGLDRPRVTSASGTRGARRNIGSVPLSLLAAALVIGCPAAEPPPAYEEITLEGSPYERGFAHGERFSSKIRSLYTQLLTSSLLPSLNRERPDIAEILIEYGKEEYDDGRFSFQIMVESAYHLEESLPERYIEEMQGIAAGAKLPYEEVLVLNTFVDSVLGVRTLQRYLGQWNAPSIASIAVVPTGTTEDPDEDWIADPYSPSPHAHFTEVPTDASIRIFLEDEAGVDPSTVRVRLDDDLFIEGDEGLTLEAMDEEGAKLRVTISPPGGLPDSSVVSIGIEAGNFDIIEDPPPTKARHMRQQWIVIGTAGISKEPHEIRNVGGEDERFPPPPVSFAARGEATADGAARLAHHFSLLDAGSAHKHVVLFTHIPDDGMPHVTVGWTGIVGGFSGMNSAGLVWSVNHSDTLDNPVVGELRTNLIAARLLSDGLPVPMLGREVLARAEDVEAAVDILVETQATVGWNHLVAGPGGLRAVEAAGDILGNDDRREHVYGPNDRDEHGRRMASVGANDLRMASHFVSNSEDIDISLLSFPLPPQRYWSPFWNRSLRAFYLLGDLIEEELGALDTGAMIDILNVEGLVDPRDSMNAVVYEPEELRLWLAAGTVPATDSEFVLHEVPGLSEVQ